MEGAKGGFLVGDGRFPLQEGALGVELVWKDPIHFLSVFHLPLLLALWLPG